MNVKWHAKTIKYYIIWKDPARQLWKDFLSNYNIVNSKKPLIEIIAAKNGYFTNYAKTNQYVFPIDICYSEKKQDITYEGNTEESSVQGGSIGTQQNDLNNVSQYSNVNRNVMRILEQNKQISTVSASSVNAADISCDFHKREGLSLLSKSRSKW